MKFLKSYEIYFLPYIEDIWTDGYRDHNTHQYECIIPKKPGSQTFFLVQNKRFLLKVQIKFIKLNVVIKLERYFNFSYFVLRENYNILRNNINDYHLRKNNTALDDPL